VQINAEPIYLSFFDLIARQISFCFPHIAPSFRDASITRMNSLELQHEIEHVVMYKLLHCRPVRLLLNMLAD